MENEAYCIQTDYFAGPLDLLLHLIKKRKLNILDIRLADITAEYLQYLEKKDFINPSREGDFLMTAATLIYIKSRTILPQPDGFEDESPEKKLINTLIEYDKIQKISKLLKDLEAQSLLLWRREEIVENFVNQEYDLEEVTSFQLAEIFLNIVKRKDNEPDIYLESKDYSIAAKWQEIISLLDKEEYLDFTAYVNSLDTIEDILVSFFTLLEMIKQGAIIALQKRSFDTISVWKKTAIEKDQ